MRFNFTVIRILHLQKIHDLSWILKLLDKVITNNYAGQGVTLDELFERPLTWTKQTVDKFIDNDFVGKDRVYYEPVINPTTNIISSISVGSSVVYVNSVRPLFDNPFEGIGTKERSIVEIIFKIE